jgi:Arc/MetJ-type ribon-helix-helix transcriptional regulator
MSSVYLDTKTLRILDEKIGPFKEFKSRSEAIRCAVKETFGGSKIESN